VSNTELQQKELGAIANRCKGILRPCDVVSFARRKTTALHSRFEWNDGKAAQEYRLWQARQIIRVWVDVVHEDVKPFRVFVSLSRDRKKEGGGYRRTSSVLSDATYRAELIAGAMKDLARFKAKYHTIKDDLAPVFAAIEEVKGRKAGAA